MQWTNPASFYARFLKIKGNHYKRYIKKFKVFVSRTVVQPVYPRLLQVLLLVM